MRRELMKWLFSCFIKATPTWSRLLAPQVCGGKGLCARRAVCHQCPDSRKGASSLAHLCFCTTGANINTGEKTSHLLVSLWSSFWLGDPLDMVLRTPPEETLVWKATPCRLGEGKTNFKRKQTASLTWWHKERRQRWAEMRHDSCSESGQEGWLNAL